MNSPKRAAEGRISGGEIQPPFNLKIKSSKKLKTMKKDSSIRVMSSDDEKTHEKNLDLSNLLPVYPDAKKVEDLTESDVSSDEHQDNVGEGIDVLSMNRVMKRQATLCPVHSLINNVATQTHHTGPIGLMGPGVTNSEYSGLPPEIQRIESVFSKQPIYSFSYNKDGKIQESGPLPLDTHGKPLSSDRFDQDSEFLKSVKLDKKLLSKGGKIRRGTVFGKKLEQKVDNLNLNMNMNKKVSSIKVGSSSTAKKRLSVSPVKQETIQNSLKSELRQKDQQQSMLGHSFVAKQPVSFFDVDL